MPEPDVEVVWGALWTWAFGESFRALRYSTLALAALTIVVINRLLSRAGVPRTPLNDRIADHARPFHCPRRAHTWPR